VVTLMLVGVIHQQRGDIGQAQAAYEKILVFNPRFAAAANNLAWIHSEHGGEEVGSGADLPSKPHDRVCFTLAQSTATRRR
jgi:hypothetical protein